MRKKVLVVDPSLYSRMVLRDMLSIAGYSVCEAVSGSQAIDSFKRDQPDFVMMDACPKDMDGATAIEQLRALDPTIVAIICASNGQRNVVSQAFDAGATAFCSKPYKEKGVKDALSNMGRQPAWN